MQGNIKITKNTTRNDIIEVKKHNGMPIIGVLNTKYFAETSHKNAG